MISRRELLTGASLSFVAMPRIAKGQQVGKVYRVGVLSGGPAKPNPVFDAFRQSLSALGWVEGRTITIEARFADGKMDRLAHLAMDLVRLDVHVIVAGPSTVAQAAHQATTTIPIVMAGVGDPIKLGFVTSLHHPDGNMTGLASLLPELETKSFQLLAELVPALNRIAVLLNPDNPLHDARDAEAAAAQVGVQIVIVRARNVRGVPGGLRRDGQGPRQRGGHLGRSGVRSSPRGSHLTSR
jgi:putative tryptophan/tyrosine transport system substrate-binding protein